MIAVLPAAAGGLPDSQPVGSPVAGAGEALPLDEGLHQADRMAVLLLPVRGQSAQDLPQKPTGQMRHPHHRQDQEARIVGDQVQISGALFRGPAEVPVARAALPGRRSEQQTPQQPAPGIGHRVLEVFPDGSRKAQVMKLGQGCRKPGPGLGVPADLVDLSGPSSRKRSFDGVGSQPGA